MTGLLALDLGSTSFRALHHRPGLSPVLNQVSLPPGVRRGLRVTFDPLDLWKRVRRLLGSWEGCVAMATQRSSFLLWETSTLAPVTPLISWQDTRAAAWCSGRREAEPRVRLRTGLVLSPHYVGPKLASLWVERPDLRRRAAHGDLRLGTLDTYFASLISAGELHVMDPTQAQRTSLWNLEKGDWDEDLLHFFDVPRSLLPSVGTGPWRHRHGEVLVLLADQSAAALGLSPRTAPFLVNLGTGGFVLSRSQARPRMGSGLLVSHLGKRGERTPWMAEGTVNGIATTFSLSQAPEGSSKGDESDPEFGLPDFGAVGAPWWRPGVGPLFSPRCSRLTGDSFRMTLAQGLAFRVREILESLPGNGSILLSGGLSRDAHVREALRRCMVRNFLVVEDPEMTLRGLLGACGVSLPPLPGIVLSSQFDSAMDQSYAGWKRWVRRALG